MKDGEKEREVASLLLLSCLSNEQTKPFVRELSASASAWEDNIIFIERNSLSFHCLSFFFFFFSIHPSESPLPPPSVRPPLKSSGVA